jgi:hypothetical protein
MSETFESSELREVKHNPWVMGLALSPLLLSLAAVVAAITVDPKFMAVVFHPAIAGIFATFFAWRRNWRPRFVQGAVRADRAGIRIGERLVPHAAIKEAFVVPRAHDKPTMVRVVRRGLAPAIELAVRDVAEGRRLLHAMGFDASQTVAHFRVMSQGAGGTRQGFAAMGVFVIFSAAMGAFAALARHREVIPVLLPLGVMAMAAMMLTPTHLDVGADGVATRWLFSKRFIGYGEVLDVSRYEAGMGSSKRSGIALTLHSGEVHRIPVGATGWDDARIAMVEERIREAMDTFRQGGADADAALLRRGDRPVAEWMVALRAIGAGANATMRTAPLARDRLWRILEDPQAGHTSRVAAAVALGVESDEADKARLREAAEATAAPRLRVAIEAAAAARDEELAAAYAEIEEAEAAEQKKRAS